MTLRREVSTRYRQRAYRCWRVSTWLEYGLTHTTGTRGPEHGCVSQMDCDHYAVDSLSGRQRGRARWRRGHCRMASSKVQLLGHLMRQHLGDARKLKILDIVCGVGLAAGELVCQPLRAACSHAELRG